MAENSEREEILERFCSLSGMKEEEARSFLEQLDWNFDEATSLVFGYDLDEGLGSVMAATDPISPISFQNIASLPPLPNIASLPPLPNISPVPPLPPNIFSSNIQNYTDHETMMQEIRSAIHSTQHDFINHPFNPVDHMVGEDFDSQNISTDTTYNEWGVRAPDPVRRSTLISASNNMQHAGVSHLDAPTVVWMFPPPSPSLTYTGPLQTTKTIAKNEKKWIISCIQNHEDMSSNLLNKFTWSQETVVEIIQQQFLFWQRGTTSQDGIEYMRLYNVTEDSLPRIAIIDPRTGAEVFIILGFITPEDLSIYLIDFLNDNNIDSTTAPRTRIINMIKEAQDQSTISQSTISQSNDSTILEENSLDNLNYSSFVSITSDLEIDSSFTTDPATPPTSTVAKKDWGNVPEEPSIDAVEVTKISIKLITGKPVIRKYNLSDSVSVLFAVAQTESKTGESFDLITTFPSRSLSDCLDATLAEVGLQGCQIIMRKKE